MEESPHDSKEDPWVDSLKGLLQVKEYRERALVYFFPNMGSEVEYVADQVFGRPTFSEASLTVR